VLEKLNADCHKLIDNPLTQQDAPHSLRYLRRLLSAAVSKLSSIREKSQRKRRRWKKALNVDRGFDRLFEISHSDVEHSQAFARQGEDRLQTRTTVLMKERVSGIKNKWYKNAQGVRK